MSKYTFTFGYGGEVIAYAESNQREERMDAEDGLEFGEGSGYLHFWRRCMQTVQDLKAMNPRWFGSKSWVGTFDNNSTGETVKTFKA